MRGVDSWKQEADEPGQQERPLIHKITAPPSPPLISFLPCFHSVSRSNMTPRTVVPLDKNWEFKQADKDESSYLSVGQFPTNVHLDLLHHGLIPDPFIGKNELDVQWIGEAQWVYRTKFSSGAIPQGAKAVLAFDGLDTFATVTLNGQTILETDNMFTPERVDVTSVLKEENELVIHFDSAYLRGWKLVEKYPDHKWGCWNGDNSRLAVRKAQYHWVSESPTHTLLRVSSPPSRTNTLFRAGTGARPS